MKLIHQVATRKVNESGRFREIHATRLRSASEPSSMNTMTTVCFTLASQSPTEDN